MVLAYMSLDMFWCNPFVLVIMVAVILEANQPISREIRLGKLAVSVNESSTLTVYKTRNTSFRPRRTVSSTSGLSVSCPTSEVIGENRDVEKEGKPANSMEEVGTYEILVDPRQSQASLLPPHSCLKLAKPVSICPLKNDEYVCASG